MESEQTWPTAEELAEAESHTKKVKRIPKGMSDYQAAWIPDCDAGTKSLTAICVYWYLSFDINVHVILYCFDHYIVKFIHNIIFNITAYSDANSFTPVYFHVRQDIFFLIIFVSYYKKYIIKVINAIHNKVNKYIK